MFKSKNTHMIKKIINPRINIENDKVFININYKIGENFKEGEAGCSSSFWRYEFNLGGSFGGSKPSY